MENLLLESTEFDLSVMESVSEFTNRMNILDIKLAEESVDEDYYTEAVGKTISDFIKAIIKKITEFAEMIKEKISEFITKQQVMKRIKAIQKEYARNKAAYTGKTIQLFDYKKYAKAFSNYVKDIDKANMELSTRKFKNVEDAYKYVNQKCEEIDRRNLSLLQDVNRYCNQVELHRCINDLPNTVKAVEATCKFFKQTAVNSVSALRFNIAEEKTNDDTSDANEAVKNKVLSKLAQNISRISQMAMRNLMQGLKITMSGVFAYVTVNGVVNAGRGIAEKDAKQVAKGVAVAGMGAAALKGNMS